QKHDLDQESFVEAFRKFPPFRPDYGNFSEKAIKKLLPLMRFGKNWNYDDICRTAKMRIDKIITGEYDENIKTRIREKAQQYSLASEDDFRDLPLWLAQYIVYDRHSEARIADKWN